MKRDVVWKTPPQPLALAALWIARGVQQLNTALHSSDRPFSLIPSFLPPPPPTFISPPLDHNERGAEQHGKMAPLTAIHRSTLPPTGTSHALSCNLSAPEQGEASGSRARTKRLSHLIKARKSVLQIYEVLEYEKEDGVRPLLFFLFFVVLTSFRRADYLRSSCTPPHSTISRYRSESLAGENVGEQAGRVRPCFDLLPRCEGAFRLFLLSRCRC
jgi:hypothetical protein